MPGVTPGQIKYLMKAQRLLFGVEAMQLQGVPFEWQVHAREYSDRKLTQLAGNAFNMLVVMARLML